MTLANDGTISITDLALKWDTMQLMPTQGIVIHINNTQARITIDLVEPDDGAGTAKALAPTPETPGRILPSYRWTKPEPPV